MILSSCKKFNLCKVLYYLLEDLLFILKNYTTAELKHKDYCMCNFVFLNTVPISLGKKGYSCTTLPASCIQVCVKGPVRKARKSIA